VKRWANHNVTMSKCLLKVHEAKEKTRLKQQRLGQKNTPVQTTQLYLFVTDPPSEESNKIQK
jgi:hypothetical protein